jgi:predicted dehydrogenase
MGAAHSQGWRVAPRFFDLDAAPVMQVVVGRNGADASAQKWGWNESATDWREVIARDDIDIIDIVTPGDSHAEIAIAALAVGKHVLCEKPLANTVDEASAMADAAAAAARNGVISMLGHTYRRLPATTFARATCRTGSPTPRPRSPGACRRILRAPARSATSAPTSSTSASSSPA